MPDVLTRIGQAGSPAALDEACLPYNQGAGNASAINISDPDTTAFDSFEGSLYQESQQQEQEQQQQEQQQLVLFNPTDGDSLNQPYLPWDFPGIDQHLYPFTRPTMADDQRYLSPFYYVVNLSFNSPLAYLISGRHCIY